jgi:GT2 family glycosyltransferase
LVLPPGGLDALIDVLEADPRTALVAPHVVGEHGRPEPSAGYFPSLRGEWNHAVQFDRLFGWRGRSFVPPDGTLAVDWASASCWVLRRAAVEEIGALDEGYFMYFEDVDYCRRLRAAGWGVRVTSSVVATHGLARGSARTTFLPADGGTAPLRRYFATFEPDVPWPAVERALRAGWRLRRWAYAVRARFGDPTARERAAKFDRALREGRGAPIDTPSKPPIASFQ